MALSSLLGSFPTLLYYVCYRRWGGGGGGGGGGEIQKKSEVLVGIFAQIFQFTTPLLAYQSWFTRAVVRVRSPQVSVRFAQIIPSISSRLAICSYS